MKKFNLKQLSLSVVTALGLAVTGVATTTSHASDIEIYTVPDSAQKTIVMMLDTSGSMRLCDTGSLTLTLDWLYPDGIVRVVGITTDNFNSLDYFNTHVRWDYSERNKAEVRRYIGTEQSTTTPSYARDFCYGQNASKQRDTSKKYYDRMTKLKDAVFALMDSNQLDDTMHVSVGQFTDGRKGMIQIASAPLTPEHRARIKQYIANLGASGATPTASAYAEAAAYLMGTNTIAQSPTVEHTRQLWVAKNPSDRSTYYYCGRKDARPSKLTDPISELNVDSTGACTGIAGSTLTKTLVDAMAEGFSGAQKCRGLNGNGLVWTGAADVDTYCLFKENDRITISSLGDTYNANYSGFAKSIAATKESNLQNYKTPLPAVGRECSGQAIYFLTDGYPNSANSSQYLMRAALGSKAGDFPTDESVFNDTTKYLDSNAGEGMGPAGELAKRLRNKDLNPQGVSVSTALVGFGADFAAAKNVKTTLVDSEGNSREYYNCSLIGTRQIKNACNFGEKSHPSLSGVGGYGEGGFYYAEDSQDVIDSFLTVAKDIKTEFTPVNTGAPTVPLDSLLAGRVSDYAYYGSFTPRPDKAQQLWTGDMNKYRVDNGVLKSGSDKNDDGTSKTAEAISALSNVFNANGSLNAGITGLWGEGLKSKLTLRDQANINRPDTGRIILTNRKMQGTVASNSTELQRVTVASLYGTGALANDTTKRNYWLNALGYNIGVGEIVAQADLAVTRDTDGKVTSEKKPELRQIGATMHSKPILLTQRGKIETGRNATTNRFEVSVTGREDYLLFGSTQGILHVVDSDTGREKFAFIPHEMMENQAEAFLAETSTTRGKNNLFYGIDGAWTAHTQYVPVSADDSTLTVSNSQLRQDDDDNNSMHLRGMQWVYGGLRMGGQSYYALDLSNMNTPALKFHIDPKNNTVYTGNRTLTYPQLQHMGQSWSQPTLGYVRWNGERRLVMFVGGGYDTGYEDTTYQQTNAKGAGVYMFDADSGELLWWASSHSTTGGNVALTRNADLKYSVVSRINTFDRDGDGFIDNLYFGDLGGQAFRIDLNNESQTTENNTSAFGHRVTRIMNEHKDDGTSPRFYVMPSLSIHSATTNNQGATVGNGQRFLVVSFGSGDSSSPLAGVEASVQGVSRSRTTAQDGVFVVYDNDVSRPSLYSPDASSESDASGFRAEPLADSGKLQEYNAIAGVPQITTENGNQVFYRGWKRIIPENQVATTYGRYKVLNAPNALTDLLFVNMYNKDENNASSACGGGVRGTTYMFQYCLPTGQCSTTKHGFASTSNEDVKVKVGSGNIDTAISNANNQGTVNSLGHTRPGGGSTTCDPTTNPLCYKGNVAPSIKQLRWYESQ